MLWLIYFGVCFIFIYVFSLPLWVINGFPNNFDSPWTDIVLVQKIIEKSFDQQT